MKEVNGLPILQGPLFAPDGTEVADWWELAEWFRKHEGPLHAAAVELTQVINGALAPGDTARRLGSQSSAYRDAYESLRRIAESQIHEDPQ